MKPRRPNGPTHVRRSSASTEGLFRQVCNLFLSCVSPLLMLNSKALPFTFIINAALFSMNIPWTHVKLGWRAGTITTACFWGMRQRLLPSSHGTIAPRMGKLCMYSEPPFGISMKDLFRQGVFLSCISVTYSFPNVAPSSAYGLKFCTYGGPLSAGAIRIFISATYFSLASI
jgi:hypothetical protein